jgi:hypothetical protein
MKTAAAAGRTGTGALRSRPSPVRDVLPHGPSAAGRARALNAGILVLGAPLFLMLAAFAAYLIRRKDD